MLEVRLVVDESDKRPDDGSNGFRLHADECCILSQITPGYIPDYIGPGES
jgi:hypothetical protein